jgi:hypothetical protein
MNYNLIKNTLMMVLVLITLKVGFSKLIQIMLNQKMMQVIHRNANNKRISSHNPHNYRVTKYRLKKVLILNLSNLNLTLIH